MATTKQDVTKLIKNFTTLHKLATQAEALIKDSTKLSDRVRTGVLKNLKGDDTGTPLEAFWAQLAETLRGVPHPEDIEGSKDFRFTIQRLARVERMLGPAFSRASAATIKQKAKERKQAAADKKAAKAAYRKTKAAAKKQDRAMQKALIAKVEAIAEVVAAEPTPPALSVVPTPTAEA